MGIKRAITQVHSSTVMSILTVTIFSEHVERASFL